MFNKFNGDFFKITIIIFFFFIIIIIILLLLLLKNFKSHI